MKTQAYVIIIRRKETANCCTHSDVLWVSPNLAKTCPGYRATGTKNWKYAIALRGPRQGQFMPFTSS